MLDTALDAKAQLELEGLYVSSHNAASLWIAATVRDGGEGIRMSDDACSLSWNSGRWVALFPAEGLCVYEVPGTLAELVGLISTVFSEYRRAGGPFKDAFRKVVSDPDRYVVGRSWAGV